MTDGRITCVGCGKGIGNRAYVMDDSGETGCPACFTDDGSGECWNPVACDAPNPHEGGHNEGTH